VRLLIGDDNRKNVTLLQDDAGWILSETVQNVKLDNFRLLWLTSRLAIFNIHIDFDTVPFPITRTDLLVPLSESRSDLVKRWAHVPGGASEPSGVFFVGPLFPDINSPGSEVRFVRVA